MLLRVDKVRGGNGPSDPRPSPDPPLHACLATASVGGGGGGGGAATQTQGGTQFQSSAGAGGGGTGSGGGGGDDGGGRGDVLAVGRKGCDASLDDKCVSRSHATIALLSDRPLPDGDSTAAARKLLGDDRVATMMEYGRPSTPEEERACATSPTGMICVVRDRGSKFGTYVGVDEGLLRKYGSANANAGDDGGGKDDGSDTGDETDDGNDAPSGIPFAELTPKQLGAVRLLSGDDDGADSDDASELKFVKVPSRGSMPLLQLSHSDHLASPPPRVVLLFGPQGSAILLSLLPLHLAFSRVKKPALDPLLACLRYVGARRTEPWDPATSTHLVTPEKTAAAKGIMAWATRKPCVTGRWVEALLDRRGCGDPLPREEEYCPPGNWDEKLLWTSEPSSALRGYRIAVLVDGDDGPLAASAGADVVDLRSEAPTEPAEVASHWEEQVRRARADKVALAVATSGSRKCKRLLDALKAIDGVRFTNLKSVAKAITGNDGRGEALLDANKVPIERVEGWDAPTGDDGGGVDGGEGDAGDDEADGARASRDREATALDGDDAAAADDAEGRGERPPSDDVGPPDEEPVEERTEGAGEKKRRRPEERGGREEGRGGERRTDDRRKRPRETPKEDARTKDRAEEADPAEEEEDDAAEKSTAKRSNQSSRRTAAVRDDDDDVSSSDEAPGAPAERVALPATADGWMVAAPRRRRAHRREVVDAAADVPDSAAETERVTGLVVRAYVPPNQGVGSGGGGAARAGRGGKEKDFKRFRKNHVLRGYTSFDPVGGRRRRDGPPPSSLPAIRLVERAPKESERQRQLQQQQAELEREREIADALFEEAGARSGRKRGKGSMHAFLSQSSTKRGRGRR
ncbi:hypothetical protein ACHAWF_017812 [Thalassiosira exigua]